MKRFGEKAMREALENGAIIRDWDWYMGKGYRVIIDGQEAGYIVGDLFTKLLHDGALEKSSSAYSYRDYKASASMMREAAGRKPYGVAACILSIESERELLGWDAAKIAARLQESEANNGVFFNRNMWRAFAVVFPEYQEQLEQEQLEQQLQDQLDQLDQLEQQLQEVEEKLEQLQELQQEQEQQQERATYTNLSSGQESTSAAEAMQWHRAGDRVRVERGGRAVDITGAAQKPAQDENRNHCRYIAHELEKYARGDVYSCPECGELLELPDDVGDKYRCPHCGTVHELEQLEQLGLYDYFQDCLDIEYRIGGDREYRSVRVMVACGGPNIFIDTETRAVELYWWGSNARYLIDTDTCDQVDEWAEELFNL